MYSNKQLVLGALGFILLAWLAFMGMSALIDEGDVQLKKDPPPEAGYADLHVQLLDPSGEPPEDCVVTLWRRVDGVLQAGPKTTGRCVGGDLGWKNLPPGSYLLEAAVPGAARYAHHLELSPGDKVELGVEQLEPGGVLEVSVVGPDDRPLPGAKIWLGNWLVTSNVEGRFRFLGARLGKQVVRAQFDNVVAAETFELKEAGEKAELTVKLEELVIRGVLGVEIAAEEDGIHVTRIYEDGPAVGVLEEGDRIISAGGVPSMAISQKRAESLLDGPPGEALKLTVIRGLETLELEVVRADLLEVLTARLEAQAALPPREREK